MIVDVGIAGILVDQAFAPSEMVITDLKDHLDLISSNVERNLCQNVKVLEYDWCHPPPLGTFDIILVFEWCDPPTALASSLTSPVPASLFPPSLLSVYREELYEPLIECLKLLCHEESVILLGLTRSFAKPDFFHLMRAHGLRYTMVPMEALPASYYTETAGSNVGLFLGTIH
jgi:hypothetical protein